MIVRIDPGPPVILVEQQIEITGSGRDEPFLQQALARSPLRTGARLSHRGLRPAEGRAAAHRRRQRLSRCRIHPQRTCWSIPPRTRRARGSHSKPASATASARRPSSRISCAPIWSTLPALPRGRLVRRRRIAAHAIRAGRLAVFRRRRGAARGTRPRAQDSPDPDHRPDPTSAISIRLPRAMRPTPAPRHARLGEPPPELERPPAARRHSRFQYRGSRSALPMRSRGPTLRSRSCPSSCAASASSAPTSRRPAAVSRWALTEVLGNWQRVLSVTADATTRRGRSRRPAHALEQPAAGARHFLSLLPPGFLGVNAVPRGFQVGTDSARPRCSAPIPISRGCCP